MALNHRAFRLGTKIAFYTFVFGAIIGVTLTLIFSQYTLRSVLAQAEVGLTEQAHQAAFFVDSLLASKTEMAITITAALDIETAVAASNAQFAALPDEIRSTTIQELDERWRNTDSIDDPFIAQYLENDAATYLSRLMVVHPSEFGEIFLTNRFGALIASTGKLTTLAHAHKPWWVGSYNDGQGAIFLDDRGYDISVGDYVLGVVVPVMSGSEVGGILKCNVSILASLGTVIATTAYSVDGDIMLVRSNGLIVYGKDRIPLQSATSDELTMLISENVSGCAILRENETRSLIAFWEVPWTSSESTSARFGGTSNTDDHDFGNSGESWVVVVSQELDQVMAPARMATLRMALIAAGFIIVMAVGSLLIGWRIGKPARMLAEQVHSLGPETLTTRVVISSRDEVGTLAQSFNEQATYLEATMVSKDKLMEEVAQRQLVEAVLRESEKRYRTLFENMINGFALHEIVLNNAGKPVDYIFLEVNSAFERLTGLKRDEIIDKTAREVLPGIEHDPANWISVYGDVAVTGKEARFEQYSEPLSKWFSVLAFKSRDGQFATIFEDITDRKHAEKEKQSMESRFRQQQKLESLGTMARGVAHEINNPLMGMINYADLINERTKDRQLAEFASEIMTEGNRVAKIVASLRAFSRQETAPRSLASIKDVIDSSLMLVGSLLRRDQITVVLELDDDLPPIQCRSQQIQQVLINLLTNAHHFLNDRYPSFDENKILRIITCTFEENDQVWIRTTVEDHGAGIPEDVLDRIFDPFFSTKSRHEGSGLGLSVSFGIVREHQGNLSAESVLGDYTRVHMDLPANPE